MDDSFSFRTTAPIRRQLDPRALKAAVFVGLVALGIGSFANWVISSERESFARADRRGSAAEPAVGQIAVVPDPVGTDADAKTGARIALVAARAAFAPHRTFLDAGPAQLSVLQPGYSFVDGPSTTPRIVSVATRSHVWAAAIQSPTGTCFWVRTTDAGRVDRGTTAECTGEAALTAAHDGW